MSNLAVPSKVSAASFFHSSNCYRLGSTIVIIGPFLRQMVRHVWIVAAACYINCCYGNCIVNLETYRRGYFGLWVFSGVYSFAQVSPPMAGNLLQICAMPPHRGPRESNVTCYGLGTVGIASNWILCILGKERDVSGGYDACHRAI